MCFLDLHTKILGKSKSCKLLTYHYLFMNCSLNWFFFLWLITLTFFSMSIVFSWFKKFTTITPFVFHFTVRYDRFEINAMYVFQCFWRPFHEIIPSQKLKEVLVFGSRIVKNGIESFLIINITWKDIVYQCCRGKGEVFNIMQIWHDFSLLQFSLARKKFTKDFFFKLVVIHDGKGRSNLADFLKQTECKIQKEYTYVFFSRDKRS